MAGLAAADGMFRLLEADIHRLQNAVAHLLASNSELKVAIEAEGDEDRTFKTAIEENIVVIAKYRAQIARLEQELQELRGGQQQLGGGEAVVTCEEPAAAAGQQQRQQDGIAAVHSADTAMRDAAEQQPEQQPGGGGMWM